MPFSLRFCSFVHLVEVIYQEIGILEFIFQTRQSRAGKFKIIFHFYMINQNYVGNFDGDQNLSQSQMLKSVKLR